MCSRRATVCRRTRGNQIRILIAEDNYLVAASVSSTASGDIFALAGS
jgi:hypothetical protein